MGHIKPDKFSALVPFAGFESSCHSARIDDAEEQLFNGDDGQPISYRLYEMFWMNTCYLSVFHSYAKTYVAELANAIKVQLDYEEMVSPKEYNFMTDRLFAKVSRSDLAKMLRAVRGQRLNIKIKDWFTSCDGFISRYPKYISRWPRIADWDHNHVGAVLACYVDKLREEKAIDREEEMAWDLITTDDIQDWLTRAITSDVALRALKLNDYLRQRAERKSLCHA